MNGQQGFVHEAWFYDDTEDYLRQLSAFVDDAGSANEPVLMAVPAERHRLLRGHFDHTASHVTLADMSDKGANPGRIIPRVLAGFMDAHADRRVNIVGEPIWPGRTAPGYAAAMEHEALINVAFSERDATIVCPYDRANLSAQAIEDASDTHPLVRDRGEPRPSETYVDPIRTARVAVGDPSQVPDDATTTTFWDLITVRAAVRSAVDRIGLGRSRAADLEAAANEVATNTLRHGGGVGELSYWTEAGQLIVEIRDNGHIDDPLVGRRVPTPWNDFGRGLLTTHMLSDLVQIWSRPAGTTVRMWIQI